MLNEETFEKLCNLTNEKPMLEQGTISVKMADGKTSSEVMGSTSLFVQRKDKPNKGGLFKFVVVKGPNNLLGRPVIKALWSDEYNSLAESAKLSVDALYSVNASQVSEVNSIASVPTAKTTAAATPVVKTTLTATNQETKQRVIPPYPTGNISQEIGELYCKKLCDECFPELFDEELGEFKGVTADFAIIPGHEKFLKVYPCAKVPHGIATEFKQELDKLNETCTPVDGRGLKVATQIVPVVKKKDGNIKVRLCGNYIV